MEGSVGGVSEAGNQGCGRDQRQPVLDCKRHVMREMRSERGAFEVSEGKVGHPAAHTSELKPAAEGVGDRQTRQVVGHRHLH